MKTQTNYRTFFGRKNVLKTVLLNGFVNIASYPRLLLEVFIRKNFGERYFSFASVISVVVVLGLFPIIGHKVSSFASRDGGGNFWSSYATWYAYLAAFCHFTYLRWQEVKKLPSVFDLARFTKHAGEVQPFFYNLRLFGKEPTIRHISIFYEPAVFLLAGLLFAVLGQPLGVLLIIASLCYGLGYAGQFMQADERIMDLLDDIIIKEQMYSVIMRGWPSYATKGVAMDARLPESQVHRQMLFDYLMDGENDTTSTAK